MNEIKLIRALLNDVDGEVITDDLVALFIEEAHRKVPYLAASMICSSRGAYSLAYAFLEHCGTIPKEQIAENVGSEK